MQRENGPVPPEFSLWQRVEVGSEIRYWNQDLRLVVEHLLIVTAVFAM